MNAKMQGIIICGVVVACLGGTLFYLNKTQPVADTTESEVEEATSSSSTEVQLVNCEEKDISKIAVSNENGDFSMYKPESGKVSWKIDELEGLNLSSTMVSGLSDCSATLKAKELVEEGVSDFAKYGLDEPRATFTVTFSDDTERTFCIGDVSPTSDRYCYLREDGSDKVYLVLNTYVSYMTEAKEAYVATSLIVAPDNDSYPDYGTLTIDRSNLDYDIVVVNDDDEEGGAVSAQVMIKPVYGYLNITNSTDTTHGMWGLAAETAVCLFPDEDDFKEYGLDNPLCTVTLVGDEYDYKLTIGNGVHEVDDDGNEQTAIASYYCYLEGVDGEDCIWQIAADNVPWATIMPEDIITTMMTYNYIQTVSDIQIDYKGEKTSFEVGVDDAAENVTSATINDEDMGVEIFKGFYEYLLTCPTSEIYFTDPTTESFMTIDINTVSGGGDTLEFFEDTSRRTIVKLNGETSYRIETKWIDQFIENIDLVAQGKEVSNTY